MKITMTDNRRLKRLADGYASAYANATRRVGLTQKEYLKLGEILIRNKATLYEEIDKLTVVPAELRK